MNSFRQPVTIHRLTGGSYVNGRYVEGSSSDISIMASIQPADEKDMSKVIDLLPEGRRQSGLYRLYTSTRLNALQNTQNPDIAIVDGMQFEVIMEASWQNNVINHYKYIVAKIKET